MVSAVVVAAVVEVVVEEVVVAATSVSDTNTGADDLNECLEMLVSTTLPLNAVRRLTLSPTMAPGREQQTKHATFQHSGCVSVPVARSTPTSAHPPPTHAHLFRCALAQSAA